MLKCFIWPDLVVVDNKEQSCFIIDVAIQGESRIFENENEKIEKYQELKREIARLWKLRKVCVIPIVVGALESLTNRFDEWLK